MGRGREKSGGRGVSGIGREGKWGVGGREGGQVGEGGREGG